MNDLAPVTVRLATVDDVELLVLGNFSGEEVRADVDGWDGAELVLGNHPDDLDDPGRLRPWEARVHRRIR